MRVVALVTDLMDRSKISAAAPGTRFVAPGAAGVDLADADVFVVDLSRPGAVDALGAVPAGVRTIAYGSHVDTAVLDAARAAGCDEVLPRSAFFSHLPTLLA